MYHRRYRHRWWSRDLRGAGPLSLRRPIVSVAVVWEGDFIVPVPPAVHVDAAGSRARPPPSV